MIVTRRGIASPAELDHLVVGAGTLAAGIAKVEQLTGVTPVPCGKHVTMGTHNALVRLGERAYLAGRATTADRVGRAHDRHRAQQRSVPDRAWRDSFVRARRLSLAPHGA